MMLTTAGRRLADRPLRLEGQDHGACRRV
jgi:hypothetical protein